MEYPKPRKNSGLGIHLSPNGAFPLGRSDGLLREMVNLLRRMGFSWAKAVVTEPYTSEWQVRAITALINQGFEVIVRLFVHKPYPGDKPNYDQIHDAVKFWVARGVHYFELRNEPNLLVEWASQERWSSFGSLQARAENAAQLFLSDAYVIQHAGGIPLTPALAPGGNDDSEAYWPIMCRWWAHNGGATLLRKSAIAAHNYMLNHPLYYPYDRVNQEGDNPGQGLLSGGGASNGFLHYRYLAWVFYRHLGFTIPVLSTEDGARLGDANDPRYPPVDEWRHRELHLQVARYMAEKAESEYFNTAFWLLGSRLLEAQGSPPPWEKHAWISPYRNGMYLPIVDALKERGFVSRTQNVPWHFTTDNFTFHNVIEQLPRHPTYRCSLSCQQGMAWNCLPLLHHA